MAVSPILNTPLVAPTQVNKTTTINDAILALEAAANGFISVSLATGNAATLSFAQFVSAAVFKCSGQSGDAVLTVPLVTTAAGPALRIFLVRNTGAYQVTVGGATGATVVVAASSSSVIECDGTDCILYASGGAGVAGPVGPPGGGIAIGYNFSTSVSGDPGTGNIAFDHSTQYLTANIFVSYTDNQATGWGLVLASLANSTSAAKGEIRVFDPATPTNWIVFELTAITDNTTYYELAVTTLGYSATNPFSSAEALAFCFSRNGDADTSILGENNLWSATQQQTVVPLSDATSIAIDFSLGNDFSVTLTGDHTLANPSNMPSSGNTQAGQIVVTQDGTGGRTLALASYWYPVGGIAPTFSTAPGAIDIISYFVVSPTYIKYTALLG